MPQHIMLSYQWDYQGLVKRIHNRLRDDGLPVWMDVEGGVTGDINDSMAAGVEEALVICPFMTPAYQESRSCKKELTYAESRGVTIIPIMLAENWEASEWLGLITAGLLWLDFRNAEKDEDQFESCVRCLKDEIVLNVGHQLEERGRDGKRHGRVFRHARSDAYIQHSDDPVTGSRVQLTALLGDGGYWEEVTGRGCTHLRNMATHRFLGFDCEQGEVRSGESPSPMEEWLVQEDQADRTHRRAVALKHRLSGRFLAVQDGRFVGLKLHCSDSKWFLE